MKIYIKADIVSPLDEDLLSLRTLANDPNLSVRMMYRLADAEDTDVLGSLAGNPNCPEEILNDISKLPSTYIAGIISENPNAPDAALNNIVNNFKGDLDYRKHSWWSSLKLVAVHPNSSALVLENLYNSDAPDFVRAMILQNPNITSTLQQRILQDDLWDRTWKTDMESYFNRGYLLPHEGAYLARQVKKYNYLRTDEEIADYVCKVDSVFKSERDNILKALKESHV